ncbi:MAG: hypothetical protein ACK53W_03520 [Gemmatimonadota bacterium]
MDTVTILLGCWGVAMTAAAIFLLFKVDELAQRQAQTDVLLKRSMDSQAAFAAMFEKAVSRTRAKMAAPEVKTSKGAKGK